MFYIVKMDNPQDPEDRGTPTRVRLIGPFAPDHSVAVVQIHRWISDNNLLGNPCWQLVDIDEPVVEVVAP